jgi:hypothetical protein
MEDINRFTSKTLLAVQNDSKGNSTLTLFEKVHENVDVLVKLKLVKKWDSTTAGRPTTRVEDTPLGRATFKGTVNHKCFISVEIW